jgi:hypothetical protein
LHPSLAGQADLATGERHSAEWLFSNANPKRLLETISNSVQAYTWQCGGIMDRIIASAFHAPAGAGAFTVKLGSLDDLAKPIGKEE